MTEIRFLHFVDIYKFLSLLLLPLYSGLTADCAPLLGVVVASILDIVVVSVVFVAVVRCQRGESLLSYSLPVPGTRLQIVIV